MIKNFNWFQKTYSSLIEKGKQRGLIKSKLDKSELFEKHHIMPKCLGGLDIDDNYVYLTLREHAIAHLLLSRMYPDNNDLSLAIFLMLGNKRIKSTRLYQEYREKARIFNTGELNPRYGKKLTEEHKQILSKANSYKRTEETKMKMSLSQTGKKQSLEIRLKESISHKGLKIHSDETKEKLSKRWTKEGNPNYGKDMTGGNNPASKKVLDPNGVVFNSIIECAKAYGVHKSTMSSWIKNKKKGFSIYIQK